MSDLIAISVISLVLLFILIFCLILSRKNRHRLQQVSRQLPAAKHTAANQVSGMQGGYPYVLHFHPPAKNRPAALSIELKMGGGGALRITYENWLHRVAKSIGLVDEVQAHEPNFNRTFYCEADSSEWLKRLLNNATWRQQVQAIFNADRGVKLLHLDAGSLWLRLSPYAWQQASIEPQLMQFLSQLEQLALLIRQVATLTSSIRNQCAGPLGVGGSIVLLLLAIGSLCLSQFYKPVQSTLYVHYIGWSVPLFVGFWLLYFQSMRNSYRAVHYFFIATTITLVALLILGTTLPVYINGRFDSGMGHEVRSVVVSKHSRRHKNRTHYSYSLQPMAGQSMEFSCSHERYRQIIEHKTMVRLWIKPGYLHVPWVQRHRLELQ